MQPISGVVQHYAWGDDGFIPRLLGVEPNGRPWAELWLGTHPSGPATLPDGRPLVDVTGPLPYLLKVLAAGEPLSLQVHPSAEQARAGHAAGRYPDPEPKPELLVALTPFSALCGIRPPGRTIDVLRTIGAADLAARVADAGPRAALVELYRGRLAVEPIVEACRGADVPEARVVADLATRYPGDPSVAVTLLLNLVHLAPGEAIQLGAGSLHAYLHGAGIELMNPSDNVVRGGLTRKPVDVDDLLAVVDPTPLADPVLPPAAEYRLAGTAVRLLRLEGPAAHVAAGHDVAVTSAGATGYIAPGDELAVEPGVTAYVATAA